MDKKNDDKSDDMSDLDQRADDMDDEQNNGFDDEIADRKEDEIADGMDDATPCPWVFAAGPDPRRRWCRRGSALFAASLLGLGLVGAACSSGPSSPGVAGSNSTSGNGSSSSANQASTGLTPAQRAAELAYSQCMRAHGVTNFPDPDSQGRLFIQGSPGNGLDRNSPTFQAAQKACHSKMPAPTKAQQEQALQNALKMSQCMRNHGIKDYPDPTTRGNGISISINGSPGSDLNPNNPRFAAAQKACSVFLPKGAKTSGGPQSGGSSVGVG